MLHVAKLKGTVSFGIGVDYYGRVNVVVPIDPIVEFDLSPAEARNLAAQLIYHTGRAEKGERYYAEKKREVPAVAAIVRAIETCFKTQVQDIAAGISIDANRADEEPWRLERLDLLRRVLVSHKETFIDREARVTDLYDHKGNLAVNWAATPAQRQQDLLAEFWQGAVFCEANIEHFVQGRSMAPEETSDWGYSPFPTDEDVPGAAA